MNFKKNELQRMLRPFSAYCFSSLQLGLGRNEEGLIVERGINRL